jgi:hypothetical protein
MIPEPRRQLGVLTAFLALAGVVTLLAVALGPAPLPSRRYAAASLASSSAGTSKAELGAVVASQVSRSVAFVTTLNGTGSGVLVSEGLVVTNAHVIWPFETVGVLFPGGETLPARVLGVDSRADLALLEVSGPGLPPPLEIGTPDLLEPGQDLFLVGYPGAAERRPDPTVATASFLGAFEWEFSGVGWLAAGAPAVGGQSGGALVDAAGRLMGITSFGSPVEVYAVKGSDAVRIAETLTLSTNVLESRRPPRRGGTLEQRFTLDGPWAQATFVTWVTPGTVSHLDAPASVEWHALDPYGERLADGSGDLDVLWVLGTPGIVHASAGVETEAEVVSDTALIAGPDRDDERVIEENGSVSGLVDVPGDRDWYFLDHTSAGSLTVDVEAQTRMRVALYDRARGALVAETVNERGFFFDDPPLVVENLEAGSYVVVVEDIAAQFGTYVITLS